MGILSEPLDRHCVLPDGTWFDNSEVIDRPLFSYDVAIETDAAGRGTVLVSLLKLMD